MAGARNRGQMAKLHIVRGYVAAVILLGVLMAVKVALASILPNLLLRTPDVFVIGLIAYLYGPRVSTLAVILSVLGYFYLYMPSGFGAGPSYGTLTDWVQFGILLFGNIIAAVAMSSLREAKQRVAERTEQLEAEIRDRKHAEDEVRKLNTELEQRVRERTWELETSNKELQTFSYSIMHDLRTPLRAIGGFSDALLKHYADSLDARGQDYLRRIGTAAGKMSRIIDDIHDLLRTTRVEVRRQSIDMSQMASEILEGLNSSQPRRKVETTVDPKLIVDADPHLLRVALDNLLGNAWKFTSSREVAQIEVGANKQNNERVYFIRDNGVGFNPAYADKLFQPFQRLHSEGDFPGTGIGLALVQRILRRHGGSIWAEGEADKGATFFFTLGEADE